MRELQAVLCEDDQRLLKREIQWQGINFHSVLPKSDFSSLVYRKNKETALGSKKTFEFISEERLVLENVSVSNCTHFLKQATHQRRGPSLLYKKSLKRKFETFLLYVGPLGLEPRLFYTKNRRVASYTMGQYQNFRAFALLSRDRAVVLGGANLIQTLF